MTKCVVISVEGNIASGKSTFMDRLRKEPNYVCFLERDLGREFLELLIDNPERYLFILRTELFESLRERQKKIESLIQEGTTEFIFVELSPWRSELLFCASLVLLGYLPAENYQALVIESDRFSWYLHQATIYLESDPGTCYERNQSRPIPLSYEDLEDFDLGYEKAFKSRPLTMPLLRLSSGLTTDEMLASFKSWAEKEFYQPPYEESNS